MGNRMSEELEQLLKNLKLRRILEVYAVACRRQGRHQLLGFRHAPDARAVAGAARGRAGVAHPARQSTRALVAGDVSLRPPTGREPQTDSRVCGVGVHRQGGKYRLGCGNRKGQNRIGLRSAAQGFLASALPTVMTTFASASALMVLARASASALMVRTRASASALMV